MVSFMILTDILRHQIKNPLIDLLFVKIREIRGSILVDHLIIGLTQSSENLRKCMDEQTYSLGLLSISSG
jgi:hypothetical protein